jgi:hypothetical protein
MITFEEYGVPLTQQMGTMAADTIVASDDDCYDIKIYAVKYDSGGSTYAPVLGDLILAHDSAWDAICLKCTNTGDGLWDGDDAGVLFLYQVNGVIPDNDVWNVVKAVDGTAVADEGTTDGLTIYNGMHAKAALLEAFANPLRVTLDGTPCTSTTLTNGLVSRGLYLENGNVLIVRGTTAVRNLKFCNATASSNAQYRIIYFF